MEPLKASDLYSLLAAIQVWSKTGFQNFLESGCAADLRDVIDRPDFPLDFPLVGAREYWTSFVKQPQYSNNAGTVTIQQFQKLLSQAPVHNRKTGFLQYASLIGEIGMVGTWWDCTASTWEVRDEFRNVLGLRAINPILQSSTHAHLKLAFLRAGQCPIWEKPPTGYRYASLEELASVKLPREDERFDAMMAYENNMWYFIERLLHTNTSRPDYHEAFGGKASVFALSNAKDFWSTNEFLVPLVKLNP